MAIVKGIAHFHTDPYVRTTPILSPHLPLDESSPIQLTSGCLRCASAIVAPAMRFNAATLLFIWRLWLVVVDAIWSRAKRSKVTRDLNQLWSSHSGNPNRTSRHQSLEGPGTWEALQPQGKAASLWWSPLVVKRGRKSTRKCSHETNMSTEFSPRPLWESPDTTGKKLDSCHRACRLTLKAGR